MLLPFLVLLVGLGYIHPPLTAVRAQSFGFDPPEGEVGDFGNMKKTLGWQISSGLPTNYYVLTGSGLDLLCPPGPSSGRWILYDSNSPGATPLYVSPILSVAGFCNGLETRTFRSPVLAPPSGDLFIFFETLGMNYIIINRDGTSSTYTHYYSPSGQSFLSAIPADISPEPNTQLPTQIYFSYSYDVWPDVGAPCSVNSACYEDTTLVTCVGGFVSGTSACPLECVPTGVDTAACGCNASKCLSPTDEYLNCTAPGEIVPCPYGCIDNEDDLLDRCAVDEYEIGADCPLGEDFCRTGTDLLYYCVAGDVNRTEDCVWGCVVEAAGDDRCFGEFEVGADCSMKVGAGEKYCQPAADVLWTCDGGGGWNVSVPCPHGCDPAGRCYDEYEIGASCALDTCEGEYVLWLCVGSAYDGSSVCSFGCDEGGGAGGADRCFGEFDPGAECSTDVCDGPTLWRCVGGFIDNSSSVCPYGCGEQDCFERYEVGATCSMDTCQVENLLWTCVGLVWESYSVCLYGCDEGGGVGGGDRCFGEFEAGADCSSDVCEGSALWSCVGSLITSSTDCPHGCDEGVCRGQFEVGASCSVDTCEGDTLYVCADSQVGNFFKCELGCETGTGENGADQCHASSTGTGSETSRGISSPGSISALVLAVFLVIAIVVILVLLGLLLWSRGHGNTRVASFEIGVEMEEDSTQKTADVVQEEAPKDPQEEVQGDEEVAKESETTAGSSGDSTSSSSED